MLKVINIPLCVLGRAALGVEVHLIWIQIIRLLTRSIPTKFNHLAALNHIVGVTKVERVAAVHVTLVKVPTFRA